MTPQEKQGIADFASKILRSYFCDGDVEFMISTFTPDIVWLGGGDAQKAEGADAVATCFRDGSMMPCRMWDEEYVVVQQAPDVYLCAGRSMLESVMPGTIMGFRQRITFIFRRENGVLKTAHIHHSAPLDSIAPEELFPVEAAQKIFEAMKLRLGDQDRQIELMLSQLPGGMQVCYPDEAFTTKWISAGLYQMLGYQDLQEYHSGTGYCREGFIVPEDAPLVRAQIAEAFAHGDSYSVEYRIRKRDGSQFWALDIGKRYADADGHTLVSCFITDISDRVEHERQYQLASQESARQAHFLTRLYETIPCGIMQFVLRPHPHTVFLNRYGKELYGYNPNDTREVDPFAKVQPEDMAWLSSLVEQISRDGGRMTYERKLPRSQNDLRWISVVMERVTNADGLEVIQVLLTDITESKTLQHNREQEHLAENKSLRAAVCSAYPLILRVNLSTGTFSKYSDAGYVASVPSQGNYADLIHQTIMDMPEAQQESFLSCFAPEILLEHFQNHEKEVYLEYQRMGNDKCYHWVSTHAILVDSPEDVHFILLVRILDEQRAEKARQEQLLRDALSTAESASRAKSDFLSRMSHDIRTPMNAIIGMSAIGQLKQDDKKQVKHCLQKIDTSSRYLLSLINDILDMARIENGKMALSHNRFDFTDMITQVSAIIYPQAEAANIRYNVYHEEPFDRYYVGDSLRLRQILLNLLSNSLKFTPAGGFASVHIREKNRANGFAYIELKVRDSGIGMTEEFLKRIFQPFEQENVGVSRSKAGAGLGLSIVSNLVQLMGGVIEVDSIKDEGTCFTVVLPLEVLHENHEEENQRKKRELLVGLSVLVADDDPMVGEQVAAIMSNIGAQSLWVDSGTKAVQAVRNKHEQNAQFDVALIDLVMPDISGIETARQIRTMVGPETTIIIITAYDWSDIETEAKTVGVNYFIAKPLFQSTIYETFLQLGIAETQRPAPTNREDMRGKRILVVEDNEINLEIALALLETNGFVVESATDGCEAVEMCQAAPYGHYHAILMDIHMPRMDGLEATRAIRALPREDMQHVPVIAMSANAFTEDKLNAARAGMDDYIVKPLDLTLFFAVLHKWIDGSALPTRPPKAVQVQEK